MRKRDKEIIDNLVKFRVMTRDNIADLHFSHLKNKIASTNLVLKRLRRDNYIEVNTNRQPYIYFPIPSIKKDGQKIDHFLSIVNFYKQLLKYEKPKIFEVEPKYSKEYMEPDIFTIWKAAPFFVEIQRSLYSDKIMKNKIEGYERYLYSDEWKLESWQPTNKKIFPYIWIIADSLYNIESEIKIFQSKDVDEFIKKVK